MFGDSLSENEKRSLATLIYYPREKMELVLSQVDDAEAWYAVTLQRLVAVCKRAAQKYTRSRVRKALPKDFAYIIEELMTENRHGVDKQAYYAAIVDAVIRTDRGGALVEALCLLIQRLAIERLHIVGDIYDRGPYPHIIMDALMEHHSLDIQWGNHDIVWMGASLGQRGCIAHVVRNCARYGNLSILEDAYGINILPLASFALEAYKDDPCVAFGLKGNPDLPPQELEMNVKIQKAMAIIQFKVEAQLIDENPGFGLEGRKLLDKIDYERGTVMLDGVAYELTDTVFPTVDPADPYRLTPEEEEVMQRLEQAFTGCEKLQRHMRFFLDAGSLYKLCNGNLLFHACVPLNADGSLMETEVFGETYKGRALYDVMERYVRAAFDDANPELAKRGRDLSVVYVAGRGIAPVRQEQDGHVRAVPDRREGGAQGGQEPVLLLSRRRARDGRHLRGLRHGSRDVAHRVRARAGEGEGRRGSGEVRRPRAHHRRRLLESLPAHHRHRRLHADLELLRLRAGGSRAARVDARRRGERAGHPFVAQGGRSWSTSARWWPTPTTARCSSSR